LLGHWGTSPGLNLVYVHLNRLIRAYDLDAITMGGPGHGGPAMIANVWLEGSYSQFYPEVTEDEGGMLRLFRQFSTPGGVPSHVSVPTRARSMKAGNWAMCWPTPLAR
jgi:xylulose-5-phosphate/fructose-6-phosphate phosphoketolase